MNCIHIFLSFLFIIHPLQTSLYLGISSKNRMDQSQNSNTVHTLFIENQGQWDSSVQYCASTDHEIIYLTKESVTIIDFSENPKLSQNQRISKGWKESTILPIDGKWNNELNTKDQRYSYCNLLFFDCTTSFLRGDKLSPSVHHYLYGNDSDKWICNVKGYQEVWYRGLYEGIRLSA